MHQPLYLKSKNKLNHDGPQLKTVLATVHRLVTPSSDDDVGETAVHIVNRHPHKPISRSPQFRRVVLTIKPRKLLRLVENFLLENIIHACTISSRKHRDKVRVRREDGPFHAARNEFFEDVVSGRYKFLHVVYPKRLLADEKRRWNIPSHNPQHFIIDECLKDRFYFWIPTVVS